MSATSKSRPPGRWLFDLGNTRLKCAPLRADGGVGEVLALPHRIEDVAAAMDAALPARFEVAYLASVASPELTATVLDALSRHCGRISCARTQPRFAGMTIAYARPHKLGVDRFLALVALHRRGGPALSCGVGTALTVDLLDAGGRHLGGRIAPSPALMREALNARAAQLPVSGGDYREFAADTEDALASGCDGAALALIARSVEEAARLLGSKPPLHVHGGGGERLLPMLPSARWSPGLVLEGLAHWATAELDPLESPPC
ncbi:type III pantothenate kinase [Marilutibacter maris]|uniref:Type III pantothenate kinase n=1 Tax=Marilutibacter maris TaxID=1605891 RepID=A0A2U9T5U6_9GAMM|nr:type III pantothenate kinase [Lysobacter maris]AWV06334.1 pantothenate kinase [Lysobacter maris]KAB8198658.1 type III pantothenate kinase [Lysobacter maris]